MREIKFRAWDTHEEVMNRVDYVDFVNGVIGMSNENVRDYEQPIHRENIMQYTGLKDNNGVEIFEGDVVRFILGDYNIREYVEEVVYSDGAFWGGNWLLFDAKMNDDDLEVLGNIYENPVLLEREAE